MNPSLWFISFARFFYYTINILVKKILGSDIPFSVLFISILSKFQLYSILKNRIIFTWIANTKYIIKIQNFFIYIISIWLEVFDFFFLNFSYSTLNFILSILGNSFSFLSLSILLFYSVTFCFLFIIFWFVFSFYYFCFVFIFFLFLDKNPLRKKNTKK